ncbi:hypothetical protein M2322_002319 [Rhodoblastus acidophilus]|uniref:hypothetical protein n=1 Tax=Rhodoblastus acidophilus TaxID=1074 RepID=UPI0022240DA5|nr:hypothetical protein [Rhodoblastus acidophilus]MCW2316765.1 hypothetical protein [Rhodoblastus acidophilus]
MNNASPANAAALPDRRLFLSAGPAAAVFSALGAAAAASPADPDQRIFDLTMEMRAWTNKANSPASDEDTTAFCCDQQEALFHLLLQEKPQTMRGVRAYLAYLIEETSDYLYDGAVISVMLKSVLASPAMIA